jgi:hypothetical protein
MTLLCDRENGVISHIPSCWAYSLPTDVQVRIDYLQTIAEDIVAKV